MGARKRTWELLDDPPEGDRLGKSVVLFILILIGINVVVCIAETEPDLARAYPGFFWYFELVSVVVFTIEYLGRLWACPEAEDFAEGGLKARARWATTPMALIDLIAIAPFFLQLLLPGLDLRFVRALRLLRLFRIFKVGRYSTAFGSLARVLQTKSAALLMSTFILLIAVIFAASVMWLCEHEAQPEAFRSVPKAMWWAIITITTIGYGDVTPITPMGKIMGGVFAFIGICLFALPVAIIGSGFVEEMARQDGAKEGAADGAAAAVCPHCGKAPDEAPA